MEDFSSRGPTVDGRVKPDLVGPDGVSTNSYGSGKFFGTSAATPHVAGAAALIKSTNPKYYTSEVLRQTLINAAVDMGVSGKDNIYGGGRLELPLVLQGTPSIHLSVSQLVFGEITIGQARTLSFNVFNEGIVSLLVDNIAVSTFRDDYQISSTSFSVDPERIQTVSVTFSPSTEGSKSSTLTIRSNDPVRPEASFSLLGGGRKTARPLSPGLSLLLSSMAFDSVIVGHTSSQILTISNSGDAPLIISKIFSSDDQFIVPSGPITLGEGVAQGVYVRFKPLAAGHHDAVITIASNDPDRPAVILPVTATALAGETSFSISLGVDSSDGSQPLDSYISQPEATVAIKIMGENIKGAVGFSALFQYDASQVEFERFELGDAIPNVHSPGPYYGTNPTYVEVTAASFGDRIRVARGMLGKAVFHTTPSFSGTDIKVGLARLRRSGQFEILIAPAILKLVQARRLTADFDGNGHVGFSDFVFFARSFGTSRGHPDFEAKYDLDMDNIIGFGDFVLFVQQFGQKADKTVGLTKSVSR